MKYKVEYWFRTQHDDMDSEIVTVEANSEEEAIEKAKSEAIRGSRNFKIMKENNEFGRMQELAGLGEGESVIKKPSPIYKDKNEINQDNALEQAVESLGHAMEILSRVDMEHFDSKQQLHFRNLFLLCSDFVEDYDKEINN